MRKLEEIKGLEFVECGDSAPATCTQIVYDLKLQLKDGQKITLIHWQDHSNLSWIAQGLQQILGLDLMTAEEPSVPDENTDYPTDGTIDLEKLENKLLTLPASECLTLSTDIIEEEIDEEEQTTTEILEVRINMLSRWCYKLFKPLAVVSFILALAAIVGLLVTMVEMDIESEFVVYMIIGLAVLIGIILIIVGSFLWTFSSEVRRSHVRVVTDGAFIQLWSGLQWIDINPKQLQQLKVISTDTWAYFIGFGIPNRKWFKFGKAYAIEMSTKENMITTAQLPFDHPECEWVCDVLKNITKYTR